MRDWTIDATVRRAKDEILADIGAGAVPSTVASFSELHDYVDANGYGGAFDPDAPEATSDFWAEVQARLAAWVKFGLGPDLAKHLEKGQQ